jgi:hypothetical protein
MGHCYVIIFDVVRKEKETKYRIEEEAKQAHKGVKYSDDHKALVLWSLQGKNEDKTLETTDTSGSLMVYRVSEIDGEKETQMNKEVANFNLQVARKKKEKFEALKVRFDKVLEAYSENAKELEEKNRIISRLEGKMGKRIEKGESS